jgi:hypothetical protein
VVEVTASTEGGEAPGGQGATTENIGPYLKKEQRSPGGCIAVRMPSCLSPRAARVPGGVQRSQCFCGDRHGRRPSHDRQMIAGGRVRAVRSPCVAIRPPSNSDWSRRRRTPVQQYACTVARLNCSPLGSRNVMTQSERYLNSCERRALAIITGRSSRSLNGLRDSYFGPSVLTLATELASHGNA